MTSILNDVTRPGYWNCGSLHLSIYKLRKYIRFWTIEEMTLKLETIPSEASLTQSQVMRKAKSSPAAVLHCVNKLSQAICQSSYSCDKLEERRTQLTFQSQCSEWVIYVDLIKAKYASVHLKPLKFTVGRAAPIGTINCV